MAQRVKSAQPGQSGADAQAHESGFRDGSIPNAPRAKLFQQAVRHMKGPAEDAHILAQDDHARVVLHFLAQCLVNCFCHG
jgi:hypothetical protein